MLRSVKTLPSAWEIRDCVITSLPLIRAGYHKAGLAIMLLLLLSEECGSSAPCESHFKYDPRVRVCGSVLPPSASPRPATRRDAHHHQHLAGVGVAVAVVVALRGVVVGVLLAMHTAGARVLCFRLVFTRCGVLSPSVGLLCCYCCSSLEAAAVVGVMSAVGAPHFSDFPREWESLGAAVMFTGIACLAWSASSRSVYRGPWCFAPRSHYTPSRPRAQRAEILKVA